MNRLALPQLKGASRKLLRPFNWNSREAYTLRTVRVLPRLPRFQHERGVHDLLFSGLQNTRAFSTAPHIWTDSGSNRRIPPTPTPLPRHPPQNNIVPRSAEHSESQSLPARPDGRPEAKSLNRKSLEFHLSRVKTWWGRLAVRTKWALIRTYRPFNADDLSALFSWIIWGHILWIILGTTTFISLVVWTMSKVRSEDMLARWVGSIVTHETGLRVVFEQAIVPNWKQGAIVLQKVFIQRRPGAVRKVVTGSQEEAARGEQGDAVDDGNYTQFDLTVDSITVTLSVRRWLAGQGILQTVEAKGIRGVVDRRHIAFDSEYEPTKHRKVHKRGDFDWETTKVEDLMVTVLQPNHQPELPPVEPFQVSVHSCELPRLRKQWLLYDMLNANYFSGSFDNAMLSLHTRQLPTEVAVHGRASAPAFKKVQRLRIDDVDIRHLNRGVSGMFGWIESGTCDFIADVMLPADEPPLTLREQIQDLVERWDAQLKSIVTNKAPHDIVTTIERDSRRRELQKTIAIDLRVQFNNPRASAPLYSPDLNYMNNAIVHPIVAYINSRDTYIPVHCHVAKRLYDFDGSWTVYDSGLMGDLSSELYRAFARNAADDEARSRRIKKVGFWSLQFLAQLVLLTLGIVA